MRKYLYDHLLNEERALYYYYYNGDNRQCIADGEIIVRRFLDLDITYRSKRELRERGERLSETYLYNDGSKRDRNSS